MIRLIVFDCDGTLVDSQHVIVAAAERAFLAQGLVPPAAAAVQAVIGLSLELAIAAWRPEAEFAERTLLADAYRTAWRSVA